MSNRTIRRQKKRLKGLTPPRWAKKIVLAGAKYVREKTQYHEGDEGEIFYDRVYSYHPTKGWRSRAA